MQSVKEWFENTLTEPLRNNDITISLRIVRVQNPLKKPGPVFLQMARAAYLAKADYFYRVNDDTEMVNNWPYIFVQALHQFSPPIAIVAPTCEQGNKDE